MSEDSNRNPGDRRRRGGRLERIIIPALATVILIPIVCCMVLFRRVNNLERTMETLAGQLEQLTGLLEAQQKQADTDVDTAQQITVDGSAEQEMQGEIQSGNQGVQETSGVMEKEEHAHRVYLTFDDGPSRYTDDILDILDMYNVKATFFVVGKEDDHSKEMMQRIVEEGHSIGMHSYSHKYSEVYQSEESFTEDFVKIQDYVYDITGVRSTIYRFPGGSSNTVSDTPMEQLTAYLESQDVTYYDWNISSGDGGSRILEVEELVDNCTRDITKHKNSVILLHDSAGKHTTVEALPAIIESIMELEDTVILPITEDTEPIQHRNT